MRTDGIHCRESAGTGSVVLVTGAAFASPWTTPTIGMKSQVESIDMYVDYGHHITAEPVSRDHFSGANEDRGILIFPVQLTTSRIGNLTRLILTLAKYMMTIDTYIHT